MRSSHGISGGLQRIPQMSPAPREEARETHSGSKQSSDPVKDGSGSYHVLCLGPWLFAPVLPGSPFGV